MQVSIWGRRGRFPFPHVVTIVPPIISNYKQTTVLTMFADASSVTVSLGFVSSICLKHLIPIFL